MSYRSSHQKAPFQQNLDAASSNRYQKGLLNIQENNDISPKETLNKVKTSFYEIDEQNEYLEEN